MSKKIPRYHLLILQNLLSYIIKSDSYDYLLEDYYIYDYQLNILYRALKEINNKNLSKDNETILIESNKIKNDIFDIYFIQSVREKELPESYDVTIQEKQIKYLYHKNKIADDVLTELADLSMRGGEGDWQNLLDLANKIKDNYNKVNQVDEILSFRDMSFHYFDYREKPDEEKRSYGFKEIDKFFPNPLEPKQCSLLVGNTGSGKSSMALAIENSLINLKIPVISINLEESRETILEKMICMRAGMTLFDVENIKENKRNQVKFQNTIEELMQINNFVFYDKLGINLNDLESIIIASKKKFLDLGVINNFEDFVFMKIDLVTRLKDFRGKKGTDLEDPANKLFELIQKYNIHALLVLQANENEVRGGNKPKTITDCNNFMITDSDIKNGSAFAEISRAVFTLNRPLFLKYKYLPNDMRSEFEEDPDVISFNLVKNNRGGLGKIKFLFDVETFRIRPFIEDNNKMIKIQEKKDKIVAGIKNDLKKIERKEINNDIHMNY